MYQLFQKEVDKKGYYHFKDLLRFLFAFSINEGKSNKTDSKKRRGNPVFSGFSDYFIAFSTDFKCFLNCSFTSSGAVMRTAPPKVDIQAKKVGLTPTSAVKE